MMWIDFSSTVAGCRGWGRECLDSSALAIVLSYSSPQHDDVVFLGTGFLRCSLSARLTLTFYRHSFTLVVENAVLTGAHETGPNTVVTRVPELSIHF